jgi:uncharacterized protein YbaR (Trm112 family)
MKIPPHVTAPALAVSPPASGSVALDALDPDFLVLLACPRCSERPPLRRSDTGDALVCTRCDRIYPVTDGFPDLRLTEEEIAVSGAP